MNDKDDNIVEFRRPSRIKELEKALQERAAILNGLARVQEEIGRVEEWLGELRQKETLLINHKNSGDPLNIDEIIQEEFSKDQDIARKIELTRLWLMHYHDDPQMDSDIDVQIQFLKRLLSYIGDVSVRLECNLDFSLSSEFPPSNVRTLIPEQIDITMVNDVNTYGVHAEVTGHNRAGNIETIYIPVESLDRRISVYHADRS